MYVQRMKTGCGVALDKRKIAAMEPADEVLESVSPWTHFQTAVLKASPMFEVLKVAPSSL